MAKKKAPPKEKKKRYLGGARVWPEDTGGMTVYQAKEKLDEFMHKLDKEVDVGHWSASIRLNKKIGTIEVSLKFPMWKKGWQPPQDAIDDYLAELKEKEASPKKMKKAR